MLSNITRACAVCTLVALSSLSSHTADAARPVRHAPTISGTPAPSVVAGNVYEFQPSAADVDGDRLTFSIANKPAWATFSTATGRLAGTPTSANVGDYPAIEIKVSDGKLYAALPIFTIAVVAAPNRAPTISGVPPSNAQAGQPYAFRPSASDADGDALTFTIAGTPAWATFDPATGTLSGTPSTSGTYTAIRICVSDGVALSCLPDFEISVVSPPTTGVANLAWSAPTRNVDGTALVDLAGYKVVYGNAPGQYTQTLSLPDPALTSVVVENLPVGQTWYFSVKAVNSMGAESDPSGEVSISL